MEQISVYTHSSLIHDLIGYLASALVLATFSMKSLRSLRITAIASNVAFISYAVIADMRPILILHCILLPMNVVRLVQIVQSEDWVLRWRPPLQLPVIKR